MAWSSFFISEICHKGTSIKVNKVEWGCGSCTLCNRKDHINFKDPSSWLTWLRYVHHAQDTYGMEILFNHIVALQKTTTMDFNNGHWHVPFANKQY
jgi:hypothetical protein